MDNSRFDIYLTGRLAAGLTPAAASERLAQLFRSTPESMRNLISGKPQLLKKGVDQTTAQKYQETLQRAGLEVAIQAAVITAPAAEVASAQNPADTGLSLAPYGAEAISAAERPQPVVVEIDTSHLSLAPQVFAPRVPTDAANTTASVSMGASTARDAAADQFTLAPAEGDLLRPEEKSTPPTQVAKAPDLTLAEPGALLETLHEEVVWVIPDISTLTLAPAGETLLSAAEIVTPPTPVIPDISHLHLVD